MGNDHDDTAGIPRAGSLQTRLPETASSLVEVDLAGLSDTGRVRRNNEDHFIAVRFDRGMRLLSSNMPEGEIPRRYAETAYGMLVADGVGGAAAGEIASRTAIHSLIDLVIETPDWIMRYDERLAGEVLHRMEERFHRIRDILAERATADPTLLGMATTLTLACSLGSHLLIAHVGDSRAYLFHDGRLERLTRDQTIAQSLADAGAISPDEVAQHPSRHVLTGALATRGAFSHVELKRSHLSDGDQILLCSDGLTEMVPEDRVVAVLRQPGPSADACRTLVDLALEAGGKDNVTVVLARYRIPEEARGAAA